MAFSSHPRLRGEEDDLEAIDRALQVSGLVAAILVVLVLAVLSQGCAVSPAAADRLRDRTGLADGIVREWPAQGDDWRAKALHRLRRGYHELRLELLGEWPEDPRLREELERLGGLEVSR